MLPLKNTSIYRESTAAPDKQTFLVAAMLTEGFRGHADRLADSCEQFEIPYALYEVPTVHKTISNQGSDDLAFTKASFIRHALDTHELPVLYIDVDCVFREQPEKIFKLAEDNIDFAVYNWLADEHTECYLPIEITLTENSRQKTYDNRFFRFAHCLDQHADDQLICSGAVQFYNNSDAARRLLDSWQSVIAEFPESTDDLCLDFAYNNLSPDDLPLMRWLDKAYARLAWWIYIRPVIDHPEFPNIDDTDKPPPEKSTARFYYPERTKPISVEHVFPRDCIIDTEKKMLLKIENNRLLPWKPFSDDVWIST